MKPFYTLLLGLLSITSVFAQPSFTTQKSLSKTERGPSKNKPQPYLSGAEVAKLLGSRKKAKGHATNARTAPEWVYSEGLTETFENNQTRYYRERLTYSSPDNYTVALESVTADGQVLSNLGEGSATVDDHDTLVYQIKVRMFGQLQDSYYYKGVYNQELGFYQPVKEKTFESENGFNTVTEYRYYYAPSDELEYEVVSEMTGTLGGQSFFDGYWSKEFRNGNTIIYTASQKDAWAPSEKREVSRQGDQQASTTSYSLGNGQWWEAEKTLTTFNSNEDIIELIQLEREEPTAALQERNKSVYTYQGGRLDLVEHFEKAGQSQTWLMKVKEELTYTGGNQLLARIISHAQQANPTTFQPSVKHGYAYYPTGHAHQGKVSEIMQYDFVENDWVPNVKSSYSYTSNPSHNSYTVEYYMNGQWIMGNEDIKEVDDRNLLVQEKEAMYMSGVLRNSRTKTYAYIKSSTITASPEQEKEKLALVVYPNPAHATVSVRFDLQRASAVSITIFTQAGQVVKRSSVSVKPAGQHQVSIPVDNLAPGQYLCQVQTANGVQTKRIVKF